MTIHEIKIGGFGKHRDVVINLREGVNIISGGNESGKSTVAAFIRAMLYGLSGRGAQNERKKFLPWDRGAKYGGELSFEHKGVRYRVAAAFGESKREDAITLYNDTTGEIVPVEATKTVGEVVLEIPPETYDLTVYAAQLSSKPDLNNANMDYLFDQLVKKSDRMKQSSSELIVGRRIKTAMDAISSPRSEKGALDILRSQKEETDDAIRKLYALETEAEQLREEYVRQQAELNDVKDQHASEKPDLAKITKAVETVSLHGEVKSCVMEINRCDEALAEAAARAKKIRRPVSAILILLLCAAGLLAAAVAFSSRLGAFSFLQRLSLYQKALENKPTAYLILAGAALFFIIISSVILSCSSRRSRDLKMELFDLEEELSGLLGTEYTYGAKHHSANRDRINAALEAHTDEYKNAKAVLDSEEHKNSREQEYLTAVEEYTRKIAYTKASADAMNKTADNLGDLEALREQSEELAARIASYQRRLECLTLAKNALEEAYRRWQADLGPVFGSEAGVLLSRLTGGRYNDLRVARNFEITLRSGEGEMQHFYSYSGATIDQMYLALRLALVKIISAPESRLPLILDDPFVQYDAKRRQSAYDVIKQFSAENRVQIILTVCGGESFPRELIAAELEGVSFGADFS